MVAHVLNYLAPDHDRTFEASHLCAHLCRDDGLRLQKASLSSHHSTALLLILCEAQRDCAAAPWWRSASELSFKPLQCISSILFGIELYEGKATTRKVAAGEELLINYGPSYFEGARYQQRSQELRRELREAKAALAASREGGRRRKELEARLDNVRWDMEALDDGSDADSD